VILFRDFRYLLYTVDVIIFMKRIKTGIEIRRKSEVIGRCGRDEKTNDHAEPAKVER